MKVEMEFEGLDTFVRNVSKLAEEVSREIDGAVEETGYRIEKNAQENAAVDTGYMKQNISNEHKKMTSVVTSHAHYSYYVEKGTRRTRAQPFMGPAVKKERPRFFKIVRSIVKNGVIK
ncbi:HK97-gp10 family putative phage morphogenesis protein [Listeria booriae]|uniref:HK97 gp10 family phage protein n=1 Tax=Listeria booriae TaxID=1552123 RepID=A0A7X1CXX2_9LIST|nr:HK97-gp10 family putative phage morphogenesis protein [Listeria booriae]MBC1290629.1 HK97 gp10 family phage protein [Listeria booriae]MBC2115686.1 HK97 gp10 family phage protein [Listeria booriae]MBC2163420.1 HK97 gp10 family phage protein [Listeria booriae]